MLFFDKPGISYIFCNIHSEMSAVIVAVALPTTACQTRVAGYPFRV